jgi:hypothetical protein
LLGIMMLQMHSYCYAQTTYDTTQYFGKMNYVFANVNKSLVTSGILRERWMPNIPNFINATLNASNLININFWHTLYFNYKLSITRLA